MSRLVDWRMPRGSVYTHAHTMLVCHKNAVLWPVTVPRRFHQGCEERGTEQKLWFQVQDSMAGFRKAFSATKRIYHHKKNGVCHIVPKNSIISWKAALVPDKQCSYLKNCVVWLTNCVFFGTNRLAGHHERLKLAQDWLKRDIRLLATFVERGLTRVCLYGESHYESRYSDHTYRLAYAVV